MKTFIKHNIKIEYIPYNKFENFDGNIIGSTDLQKNRDEDQSFIYKGESFQLNKYDDNKIYKGFIPIKNNIDTYYVAIEKNNLLPIFLFILFICGCFFIITLNYHTPDDIQNPEIVSGGYNTSDDSKFKEKELKSSNNIIIKGYNSLYLTEDDYVPLPNSSKNSINIKFNIFDENETLLYSGDPISPGKEDRFYIKDIHSKGDSIITVSVLAIKDDGTYGNGATYQIQLFMQ